MCVLSEITLEATSACVLECVHCCMPEIPHPNPLTLPEMRSLLASARQLGLRSVRLSGGEPLMFSGIVDLATTAAEIPTTIVLFTSGVYASDGRRVSLSDYPPWASLSGLPSDQVEFRISLESDKPAVHDRVTQVRGSYELALQSIRAARDAGFRTLIHHTPMALNLGCLPKLVELARSLEIDGVKVLELFHAGRCSKKLLLEPDQQAALLEELRELASDPRGGLELSEPLRLQLEEGARCAAGLGKLWVTNDGGVKYCAAAPRSFANIREMPLSEIWRSNGTLDRLRRRNEETQGQVCFAKAHDEVF